MGYGRGGGKERFGIKKRLKKKKHHVVEKKNGFRASAAADKSSGDNNKIIIPACVSVKFEFIQTMRAAFPLQTPNRRLG